MAKTGQFRGPYFVTFSVISYQQLFQLLNVNCQQQTQQAERLPTVQTVQFTQTLVIFRYFDLQSYLPEKCLAPHGKCLAPHRKCHQIRPPKLTSFWHIYHFNDFFSSKSAFSNFNLLGANKKHTKKCPFNVHSLLFT